MDEGYKVDGDGAVDAPEESADLRDPRSSMLMRCDIVDAAGRSFPCYLRNISRKGVSARGCTGLHAGQQLTIIIPVFGPLAAVVRWVSKDRFGLELNVEIDPAMLKGAGAPVETSRPKFDVLPQHKPVTDWRRPGLKPIG